MTPSHKIEDFALDPSFRAWVNGDPNAAVFWAGWLAQFPEQQPVINQARAMVRATKTDMVAVGDADIQREIDRVLRQARIARPPKVIGDEFMPPCASSINRLRLPAAALIFLGLGFGYYLLRQVEDFKVAAMTNVAPSATRAMLKRTNQTSKPITLVLPGGSVVTLNPASTIRFAERSRAELSLRWRMIQNDRFWPIPGKPSYAYWVPGFGSKQRPVTAPSGW